MEMLTQIISPQNVFPGNASLLYGQYERYWYGHLVSVMKYEQNYVLDVLVFY